MWSRELRRPRNGLIPFRGRIARWRCPCRYYTNSNDGDVKSNHGKQDIWLVRVNSNGAACGRRPLEEAVGRGKWCGRPFGWLICYAGTTASGDGDVSGNNGGSDTWILKVDANGNLVWQKNYGDSADEGVVPYRLPAMRICSCRFPKEYGRHF